MQGDAAAPPAAPRPAPLPQPEERVLMQAWRRRIEIAEDAIADGDYALARSHAEAAAGLAERLREPRRLRRTGGVLLLVSCWGESARLLAIAERLEEPGGLPEWDGSNSPSATLLITERNREHVGRPIRFARFIPLAAARVKRCIVLVEPRLTALFRRTFPCIDVRPHGSEDMQAHAEADVVAGYNTLIHHFGYDDNALRTGFTPLVPDRASVRNMRRRYEVESRPVIGISWMSTNNKKLVPRLSDWSDFMRSVDATCVSLQYGDVADDMDSLREASGRMLICDDSVDSLRDLDAYAAQVAAMDAVVTISSTCSHMAGALGIRTFVPLDDTTKIYWPATGNLIPWYPSMTFFRRRDRLWVEPFGQIRPLLQDYLTARRRSEQRAFDLQPVRARFAGGGKKT